MTKESVIKIRAKQKWMIEEMIKLLADGLDSIMAEVIKIIYMNCRPLIDLAARVKTHLSVVINGIG